MQPHGIQLIEQPHRPLGVRHQRRFGDLELEGSRGDAVPAEYRAATQDEACLAQLLQRQVQGDAARIAAFGLHVAVVHADPVQHPLADVENEVGLLGERNELRGRYVAVAGKAPAQQGLRADDPAVAQIDFRLVADHQLVALERATQLALEHQPLDGRGVHLRGIERESVSTVLLRVVHGRIRVADEVDDVFGVARAERDANARGEEHFVLI